MKKNILFILILALIVVIVWIVLSVYHNLHTSTISDTTNEQIQPINPDFDQSEIKQLESRTTVIPLFTDQPAITPSGTPLSNATAVISPTRAVSVTPPAPSGGATTP